MGNVDAEMASRAGGAAISPGFAEGFAESSAQCFVTVPATTLPNGITVPAFTVARWLAARGPDGLVLLSDTAPPWVNIGYHAARGACFRSGLRLLTELQALAIAHDLARQAVNWSGGAVGAGTLRQGLHLGGFNRAQPACVLSLDRRERRWHVLSNGEQIHDVAGNAFSWVVDDVQGDPDGVVAHTFAPDSPTVSGAPGMPLQQGLGWWPKAGSNWYGRALARGSSWSSREGAGIFTVIDERPRSERPYIGFRCTLPA
jgi:hypothetical protein